MLVLVAQRTYASGRSAAGSGEWTPNRWIVDALDAAFYAAFAAVEPTGARTLLALDVSGSMREDTIRAIVDDVVGLSWEAKAHLAIVSNNAYVWEPGSYNVDDVLAMAEYGGTQYEMLAPLLDQDWGTVVTIADYDSSLGAKKALACRKGRIGTVLDISLVGKPTFLSECVGQLADEVKPLLVAQGIMHSWY